MRKLIIHAGFHKTGTTALQHALFDSREVLASAGFSYPIVGAGTSQNASVLALAGRGWGWTKRGSKTLPQSTWSKLVKQINGSKSHCLISSEILSELNQEQIETIKSSFPNHDISVIFTLRALDKVLPSTYQQALKGGTSTFYDAWLERTLADYGEGQKSKFWKRTSYSKVLKTWIEIFGSSAITLVTVNDGKPTLLYQRFSEVLGLKDVQLSKAGSRGLNRGLLLDEIALLRIMNANFPKSKTWNEYQTFIRQGTFDPLTNIPAIDSNPEDKLRNPSRFTDQIVEISKSELSQLKAMKLRTVGSLKELSTSAAMIGENVEPEQISISKMAEVLAKHDFSLLRYIHPKNLLKHGFLYLEPKLPRVLFRTLSKLISKL